MCIKHRFGGEVYIKTGDNYKDIVIGEVLKFCTFQHLESNYTELGLVTYIIFRSKTDIFYEGSRELIVNEIIRLISNEKIKTKKAWEYLMYEFCIYSGEADSILKNSKIFDNNDDDPLYYILKFIYNNFIVINPLVAGNDFISGVLEYVGGLDVIKIMELKKAIEEKENPRGRLKFENQTINLLLHGGTYVDIGYDK